MAVSGPKAKDSSPEPFVTVLKHTHTQWQNTGILSSTVQSIGAQRLPAPSGLKTPSMRSKTTSFEIKNADLPLISLVIKTQDFSLLEQELGQRLDENPGFFNGEPAILDLMQLSTPEGETLDLMALCALVKRHGLEPIALKTQEAFWAAEGQRAGLFDASQFLPHGKSSLGLDAFKSTPLLEPEAAELPPPPAATPEPQPPVAVQEMAPAQATTLIITKPLRSGQRAYAKGGDLVVLAMVNPGAEVMADGHIHVYAPLRGRAIAGAKGDTSARIFTSCLEAELVSIAGIYRTSEVNIPKEFLGKGAQISLEGDKLVMQGLG